MITWLEAQLAHNTIFTADTLLMYWHGLTVTLQLSFLSLLLGLIFSVVLALLRYTQKPWLSWPIYFYCYVFRGTPMLIQLYIIYYGITYIDGIQQSFWWRWFKDPYYAALLAFTLNTCAYTTEIIYGALRETDHRELEAARAYGMTNWTTIRRILLPSAFRRALPTYANEVILLLQSTSVASVITIVDITGAAQNVYSRYYAPFDAFIFAALLYLSITGLVLLVFRKLEARLLAHLRPLGSNKA